MTDSSSDVLIVDDEVFFLEAIDEILSTAGFRTVRAEDGGSALEAATDPAIGVVVLDVRLPDIDGIQVLARLREQRPDLSVIMLSASTDQEIVLEALRLGACDYLAKPLHDEELVLAVGRALDVHAANAERRRLRSQIDRLAEGMEGLSQLLRLADPGERASALRQGIVDAASRVLQASRVSLMLADADGQRLSVVATRGSDVDAEEMQSRKAGEGASGLAFVEGQVLSVPDVLQDARFAGRAPDRYRSASFAIVPLICLGVPVGVLCLTECQEGDRFAFEETSLLRLLGMQVSEFLAADPDVETLLQASSVIGIEGVEEVVAGAAGNDDTELARAVCDAVASEVEPERVLRRALSAVASQLGAAPVALHLLSSDGSRLEIEAEADGGRRGDRVSLAIGEGLTGLVCRNGQLVAVDVPAEEGRFRAAVDTAADGVARPYLCVPIKLREKLVGVLRVFLESDCRTSPRTGEVLAAAFSAAVRNVLLYRSLVQSIEEMAEARREMSSRGAGRP
jgi:DNA-binding response OmpR family regulator/putative methionine-R-sulfoxide reductase with GAF domain